MLLLKVATLIGRIDGNSIVIGAFIAQLFHVKSISEAIFLTGACIVVSHAYSQKLLSVHQ